jgi:hypothetical protein
MRGPRSVKGRPGTVSPERPRVPGAGTAGRHGAEGGAISPEGVGMALRTLLKGVFPPFGKVCRRLPNGFSDRLRVPERGVAVPGALPIRITYADES